MTASEQLQLGVELEIEKRLHTAASAQVAKLAAEVDDLRSELERSQRINGQLADSLRVRLDEAAAAGARAQRYYAERGAAERELESVRRQLADEREAYGRDRKRLLDPIVRAKMLEPPPPIILQVAPGFTLPQTHRLEVCSSCQGSGEGAGPDRTCTACGGRGGASPCPCHAHGSAHACALPGACEECRWPPLAAPILTGRA